MRVIQIRAKSLLNQIKRFQSEQKPNEDYLTYNEDQLKKYYDKKNIIEGFANKEGTFNFSKKNPLVNEHHFKTPYHDTLFLSSLGLGTYMGSPELTDDLKQFNSIIDTVQSHGINMIDTAINYRFQKSDRTIGAALNYLIQDKQLVLFQNQGKIGYITEDVENGISSDQFIQNLIKENKIKADDVVEETHCLHPEFLENQLNQTLQNLQLQTLDLLYLHNPAESQLATIGEEKFYDKLASAFEFCELQIQKNKIKSYGLATWMCFRTQIEEKNLYISLQKCQEIAQKVGGHKNGFKYVQAPCNMMMPEIFSEKWQILDYQGEQKEVSLLKAARLLKLNIITSQPLMQGALQQVSLPEDVFKLQDNCARHIQFIRSIPAESLLCTLVGMKQKKHVYENLKVCYQDKVNPEEFWDFLRPSQEETVENNTKEN